MGNMKYGVPQVLVFSILLFQIYIIDLSLTNSKLANSILFADNTSIIISNNIPVEFKN